MISVSRLQPYVSLDPHSLKMLLRLRFGFNVSPNLDFSYKVGDIVGKEVCFFVFFF